MNRRRTSTRSIGFGGMMLLIAAAVVIAGCGVFYAYLKNHQIQVSRQIQKTELRISQHRLDIETHQILLDEQLNKFLILARLQEISSDLRKIPSTAVEHIDAHPQDRSLPDLARSGP